MSIVSLKVEDALQRILGSISPLNVEDVSIFNAAGRVLYHDIISDIIIPPLDNSAMDGYAIIADDLTGASRENPVQIPVIGEVQAGGDYMCQRVSRKSAIRIMTGAPIPEGADAVIMFEDTKEIGGDVYVFRGVRRGENIRLAGEDITKGQVILSRSDRLSSADIGLLASLNYKSIGVYKRPEVAIISTGDEIVDVGEDIRPGQIRNSNAYTLYSEVKKYSAIPIYMGIARDTIEDTMDIVKRALECDVVITTGGVSMGKYDFVKDVMLKLGIEILFEKIMMKPGRPCVFGRKGHTIIFGLPGNPVSTMISFIQFVRPAILRLMGAKKIEKPLIKAVLKEDLKKKGERAHYIRANFTIENGEFYVSTTGPQGSGILRSMSEANCLIILPIGIERVNAGESVPVQLIYHEEV